MEHLTCFASYCNLLESLNERLKPTNRVCLAIYGKSYIGDSAIDGILVGWVRVGAEWPLNVNMLEAIPIELIHRSS